MAMILRDDFYDYTYIKDPWRVFHYDPYIFVADWSEGVIIFKRVGISLVYLYSIPLASIGVDEVYDLVYDGTYLALSCGGYGLFIYTFTESGVTLIDSDYDSTAPIGEVPYYSNLAKGDNTWHIACNEGGVKGYQLISNVLTLVAYAPWDEINGYPEALEYHNGNIYTGDIGGPSVTVYEFTGSAYNLLGRSDDFDNVWNGIGLSNTSVMTGVGSDGVNLFSLTLDPFSLVYTENGDRGITNFVRSYGTYVYESNDNGLFVLENSANNIVYSDTSPSFNYQDTNTGDGRWVLSAYYNWDRLDDWGGLRLFEIEPIGFTVGYNGNGSTGGVPPEDSTLYNSGDTVTVLGNTGSLVRDGYVFSGWNTEAGGTGSSYLPDDTFTITESVVLYAQWTPVYAVTYNGNGSTGGTAPVDSNLYDSGDTVTVLGNTGSLVRDGYVFSSWNTEAGGTGTSYIPDDTFIITESITLYAQWTPVYTVTYNGNGNTGGIAPVDSTEYFEDDFVTILNQGSLVKDYYEFVNWNTQPDGSGTSYVPADVFSMGVSDVNLYAIWTPVVPLNVTYDENGSTTGIVPVDSNVYAETDIVTVLSNSGNLEKTGSIFIGWNTEPGGNGTHYNVGDSFVIESSTTLYSEWLTAIYPIFQWMIPTCAITSPSSGATYNQPADVTVNVSATTVYGTIVKVEFLLDDIKVGEDYTTPYSYTIENLTEGSYELTARAINSFGAVITSETVLISVLGIAYPICYITDPITSPGEVTFAKLSEVLIRAVATDPDGTITLVEFFSDDGTGSIKIGEDTIAPYSCILYDLAVGDYEITAKATDNMGLTTTSDPITLHIVDFSEPVKDNIPPITTSDIPILWNRHTQFFVELQAIDYANTEHDTPAGVYRTYYTIDGSEPTTLSSYGPNQLDNITRFLVEGQGEIHIKYFSVDNLGNTERTKDEILRLDDVPPVTTYVVVPPNGSNGWYITNPNISLIATDSSSGVLRTFYRFNSDPFEEYVEGSQFQLPSEGIHTLQYFSEDNAGNVEDVNTTFFKYDSDPPFTQDDATQGLHLQPVTVYFYTSDLASGVENTYYTTDGTIPTVDSTSGSSVTLSETGSYIINYMSVDFAGNVEQVRTCYVNVFIDTEGPGTYIYESFHINGKHGWYTSSPDISIVAVDASGIKEIQYKLHPLNEETTAKYTSTVDISGSVDLSVNHYIRIEIDQSGNPLEISLRGVIPAQTTITEVINAINGVVGQEIASETSSNGQEGNGYVTITSPTAGTGSLTSEIKFLQVVSNDATQAVFGLDETTYPHTFTETVVFVPYTTPFVLPDDNYWSVEYYSVDNENNQSVIASKRYKLDSDPPTTSVTNSFDTDGQNGWYITNPEITIIAIDNLSGVDKTYYQWDSEPWLEYVSGTIIQIPGQGEHELKVYSIDVAGNEESEKVFIYKFDQSPPVTTDDTIKYQGIIYTSRGSGHQEIVEENPVVIGAYTVRTRNVNVVVAPYIYNVTKSQEYVLSEIIGSERDELILFSVNRNEDSSRLSDWNIQLLGLGSSSLPSFDNVLKIFNKTKGVHYSVDHDLSSLDGNLVLKGEKSISLGDVLAVDYSFLGLPLSVSDIINLTYAYDNSHDPQPLNTKNYTLVESANQPYIIDYNVVVTLTPTDSFSSVVNTYYTTDGTDPTISSTQGTEISLTEPGVYIIKYFSVDIAGNIESVKTAPYNVVIDKRIPTLEIFTVPPPDGFQGWHKTAFGLDINLWSEDRVDRHDEDAVAAIEHLIVAGENDTIDFEETAGVELTATIIDNVYTSAQLAQAIENALNLAGDSTYSVDISEDTVSQGQSFVITSNLSGGGGIFNILWSSGTHANRTIATTIGFGSSNPLFPTIDSTGDDSYSSFYYKFKLNNYFIKSVEQILTSVTHKELTCIQILKGVEGFIDEILVYSPDLLPSVVSVNQELEITSVSKNYDYLWDRPVAGTLIVTKNSTPLILDVDYSFDSITNKITIFVVDSSVFEAAYSLKNRILVDYTHYIGLEDIRFGLDTSSFTVIEPIYGVPERFVDLSNDRANFTLSFPATPAQFYLQEGQHVIYARAFDHNTVLGTGVPQKQSALYELSFKLDTVSPETTHSTIATGWQKAPVFVDFVATDSSPGSGVDKTYYTIDGSTPTTSSLSGSQVIFDFSGNFTLKYFSADVAGNLESVETVPDSIQVDADPPLTSIYTVPSIPDGDNWWFVTQPTIGFNVVDFYSGPAQTFYKIGDDPTFTEYTAPFLLPQQGAVTITYYSIDVAGNIEQERIAIIKYDATSPVTTTDAPGSGYSSNPIVTFIVEDVGSGLKETHFTIDGSDPDLSSPTGTFVEFNASGVYTLKFFSVDIAGNVETIKTQLIRLDLEAPVVSNFLPEHCIITETTTQISFRVSDSLSGVDIDSILVDVDGVVYSTQKNNEYFTYTGTPAQYLIVISPITGLLNFQDVEVLRIRGVTDFAGNKTSVLEFNLVLPDILPPWIREVYPAPNVQDVSTNSNVIAYIDDAQSGVDIKSVVISINDVDFKINSRNILRIQYTGIATTAVCQIFNKSLFTFIDSVRDISISFYDVNYNTIKKIEQYFNSLPNYVATILDTRFEQKESTLLLNVANLDILVPNNLDLYPPEENLNFSFIERDNGYLVFASPNFNFSHKTPVSVKIDASDYSNNLMDTFSYVFVPHIYATPSVKKRNYLNRVALQYLADMQENIASNYTRSRSTHFYGHQKAVCLELARHLEEIEHLNEDRDYNTLRPLNIFNKLGYLLETKPAIDLSHDDYRRLLQSLIDILFKGSLKSSLQSGVALYLGSNVKIIEVVFSKGSDISDQFVFTVDIDINEEQFVGIDLIALSNNLTHVFNLVKPAHVYFIQRFVWSDQFDFQAGCILKWEQDEFGNDTIDQFGNRVPLIAADGFQASETQSDTAICDRYKYFFNNVYVETIRKNCNALLSKINTYIEDVSSKFTGAENYFYTYLFPLLKDETHVATELDVTVTVDGIEVQILEINPLTGYIRINVIPTYGSTVIVTYKYNQYFVYRVVTFYLNDPSSVFGGSSPYFNITTGEINDFIIDSGESGLEIEKLFTTSAYEIIGKINVPELPLHAHVCEQNFLNININYDGNPFIGEPFPGSIEEDPAITNPDFPEEFQRIAETKEPFMLNKIGTSFTYLNDIRYRLNCSSVINKIWKKHDIAFVTLLEELHTLNVGGVFSGFTASDGTYIYKSWAGSSEIAVYNIVSDELVHVTTLATLGFTSTSAILCKDGFIIVNAKDSGSTSNLLTLTFDGAFFTVISTTPFTANEDAQDIIIDSNNYIYISCGSDGLCAFEFNSTTGVTTYLTSFTIGVDKSYSVDCRNNYIFASFESYISVLQFDGISFVEIHRTFLLDPKGYGTTIRKVSIYNDSLVLVGNFSGTNPVDAGYIMLLDFSENQLILLDVFDMNEANTGVRKIITNNEKILVASGSYLHVLEIIDGKFIEVMSQSNYDEYHDVLQHGDYIVITCEDFVNALKLFELTTRKIT